MKLCDNMNICFSNLKKFPQTQVLLLEAASSPTLFIEAHLGGWVRLSLKME